MTIFDEIEQQAIERGVAKGIAKGVAKGVAKGIAKEKHNTIIRSWKNGIAVPMISNIADVSIDEVEKIIADFEN